VLTGTGAGIGKATALLFAREGARLVTVDLDPETGQQTLAEIRAAGGEAVFVQADTSKAEGTKRFIAAAVDTYGRLDIVFNCAGIVPVGTIADQGEDEWQRALDINLTGVFLGCKYALQQFLKQGDGGCIINMASIAGVIGVKQRGAYCATKFGVVGLTKSIAQDFAPNGIRCNCICPATVATESWHERVQASPDPQAALKAFIARQPLGRVGTPEEIAQAALYLASEEAAYITGHTLVLDGGMAP
jgi:NAD(P)-dependent dehydrogenase (short-subunit alcohol dehydrogenase family)